MATIKSYTSLEQSCKLAEILPLDSADMCYIAHSELINIHEPFYKKVDKEDIPCWSLAALLSVLPKDKSIECSISFGYYNGKGEYVEKWLCAFEKEGKTTDDYIIETTDGDNPVDACVAMIIRLKEEMNL